MNYLYTILYHKLQTDTISYINLFLIPSNYCKQQIDLIYEDYNNQNAIFYKERLNYSMFIYRVSCITLLNYEKRCKKIIPSLKKDITHMNELYKYNDIMNKNRCLLYQLMIELHIYFVKEPQYICNEYSYYFELNENCYNLCKKFEI